MEEMYMETSTYVVVKLKEDEIKDLKVEDWLRLKENDQFSLRKKVCGESDFLEIKINEEEYKLTPFTYIDVMRYLSCFELKELFDYLVSLDNAAEKNNIVYFNDDQVFEFNGDRMGFVLSKYHSNNSPAINIVYVNNKNESEELYGTLSVNLEEYGIENNRNKLAIHHYYMEEPQLTIVKEFIEMYGVNSIRIQYGFAESIMVELSDIKDIPIAPGLSYDDFN